VIAALSIRPAGAPAPTRVDSVRLIEGVGAAGDRHADPLSPRQLLLADSQAYSALALPAQALRENLLLTEDIAHLPSGTVLQLGAQALVRLMFACEACGRLDLHGARLSSRIKARRGVLARVIRGGDVFQGDAVQDLGPLLPAWPDDWRERIMQVLRAAPPDAVVEYAQLARLAGIQSSYCRAFPRLLKACDPALAARAIPARSPSPLARWDGEGLFAATQLMPMPAPGPAPAPPPAPA
jgi:MOSC domain-containing protein YiiM